MQDDDVRRLLRQNLKLSEENNRMLRKLRRDAVIGSILRIFWFAAIIGVPVYLYFAFLQPYLATLTEAYEGFRAEVQGLEEIPENFRALFENLPDAEE